MILSWNSDQSDPRVETGLYGPDTTVSSEFILDSNEHVNPARRVEIIINPISGRSIRRSLLTGFCHKLSTAGYEVRVRPTRAAGDAAAFASEACSESVGALVVVGGDGTVNDAVCGMNGKGVPILVLPGGTENILAKYFCTRLNENWLFDVISSQREQLLDLSAMNGRRFLMVAGVGFDAEVVRRLTMMRTGHIDYGSYFWPLWRSFWSYRQPRLRVELDGELIFEERGMVILGNLPRYAMGLPILAHARPDDGLIDVCIFEAHWQGPIVGHSINALLRRHTKSSSVIYRQAKRIRIDSPDKAGIELDGDWAGVVPAEFEVLDSKARFLVSPDWRAL
jgi:YegS/Rv2252/BmrU family lipid kinase